MAAPTWSVGQVLAASDVNLWFVPLAAYKTAQTARTSTTLIIDPDLQVTLAANSVYEVRSNINYQNPTGASAISWNFTAPAGITGAYSASYTVPGPTVGTFSNAWATTLSAAASNNLGDGVIFRGTVTTAGTAGTFGLLWAPSTASAGAVDVNIGSSLVLQRIG